MYMYEICTVAVKFPSNASVLLGFLRSMSLCLNSLCKVPVLLLNVKTCDVAGVLVWSFGLSSGVSDQQSVGLSPRRGTSLS